MSDSDSIVSTVRPSTEAEVAPLGYRCLITLEEGPLLILCRLIPKCITDRTLLRLEYFWRVQPGKLDLDTGRNIMILRSDFSLAFNHLQWVLMPTEDVLTRILEWQRKNLARVPIGAEPGYLKAFPNKDDWEYIFVPFRLEERGVTIFRRQVSKKDLKQTYFGDQTSTDKYASNDKSQNEATDQGTGTKDNENDPNPAEPTTDCGPSFHVFYPPYTEFPRIKSHIHPFFVTYAAGEAFDRNFFFSLSPEYERMGELAAQIKGIWKKTRIPPVPNARNKRRRPGTTHATDGKRQRTSSGGRPLTPDLSLPQPLKPTESSSRAPRPQASSLLPGKNPPIFNSAASRSRSFCDQGIGAWVDDVTRKTGGGRLDPLEEDHRV